MNDLADKNKLLWSNYLYEALGLGLFMVSAAVFTIVFEYPGGIGRREIASDLLRRVCIGCGMGLTAVGIIYSSWGKKSGAHLNPAITLTFFELGKISLRNTVFYIMAQFIGGFLGVLLVWVSVPRLLANPDVHFVVTEPGQYSVGLVFVAEMALSFILMFEVLVVSNIKRIASYTGVVSGILIALFVAFESPISGMSMNPARTLASALFAQDWHSLWLYFVAPPLGMLGAGALYHSFGGRPKHAKLHGHKGNE